MRHALLGLALCLAAACPEPKAPPSCENALDRQLAEVRASAAFQAASPAARSALEAEFTRQGAEARQKCAAAASRVDAEVIACYTAAKTPEASKACEMPSCAVVADHMAALLTRDPRFAQIPAEQRAQAEKMLASQRPAVISSCDSGPSRLGSEARRCVMRAENLDDSQKCSLPAAPRPIEPTAVPAMPVGNSCEAVVAHLATLVKDSPKFKAVPAESQAAALAQVEASRPQAIKECQEGDKKLDEAARACFLAAKNVAEADACRPGPPEPGKK